MLISLRNTVSPIGPGGAAGDVRNDRFPIVTYSESLGFIVFLYPSVLITNLEKRINRNPEKSTI